MSQQNEQTLEERVAYLEDNIRALNKATTDTAKALKALLNSTEAEAVSDAADGTLASVCPFPPNC